MTIAMCFQKSCLQFVTNAHVKYWRALENWAEHLQHCTYNVVYRV
jgi:hypothetical protein